MSATVVGTTLGARYTTSTGTTLGWSELFRRRASVRIAATLASRRRGSRWRWCLT